MKDDPIGFDRRVRLRPVVQVIPLEDDQWQVWIGGERKQLRGQSVQAFAGPLLELLDGRLTVGEVVRRVSTKTGAAPEVVREAIQRLYDWLLLDDDEGYRPGLEDGDLEPYEAQVNYFASLSSHPVRMQRRLREARIAILGLEGIGENVAAALAASGAGHLTLQRGRPVRAGDFGLFPYAAGDLGRPAGEAAAGLILRSRPGIEVTFEMEDDVREADLIIAATRQMESEALSRLNQSCLDRGRPLLIAGIENAQGFVGPYVLPHRSPCLECVNLRWRATLERAAARQADGTPPSEPLLLAAAVGQLAAVQAIMGLNRTAATVGRRLQIDLAGLNFNWTDYLRVPRCPACGPLRSGAPVVAFDTIASGGDHESVEASGQAAHAD